MKKTSKLNRFMVFFGGGMKKKQVLLEFIVVMRWMLGVVASVLCWAKTVGGVCSMKNLPKIDGEYIHYVLTWDCRLMVTRSWDGNSLEGFKFTSDKVHLCKPDGSNNPIHYVKALPGPQGQVPYLVLIIYFKQEEGTNLHSWRIVRAGGEPYYLEGHPNFGSVVGSLPGRIPRVLMFDRKTPDWLYELPMLTNLTVPGRRTQEMRQTGKIKGELHQIAAMGTQSFILNDCGDKMCEYVYSSLSLVAKASTTCVFTSSPEVVAGVFELHKSVLFPLQPEIEGPSPPQPDRPLPPSRVKSRTDYWFLLEYTMVIIYACTVASVLIVKLLIEIHILNLQPDEIRTFEKNATVFYTCIFPGLSEGYV